MANEPKVLEVNQESGTQTTYVSGGTQDAQVSNAPKVLSSQPTTPNATINAGQTSASAISNTEQRELNRGDDAVQTQAGESGTSESVVSNEARERVEASSESSSNINQTNVKASVNSRTKLLRVSTENQGTRYVHVEDNNAGFSRSTEEKKAITNTILVNEVKRLIRELGGNPDVYTKEEINEIVKTIREGQYVLVDTTEYPTLEDFLDSEGEQGTVYLYPVGNDANNYYQYIWEVSDWVSLGTTEVDLSDYAKVDQAFNVINASDIVNNTLTQAQYDLITNGKPTLIKGSFLSRTNGTVLNLTDYGTELAGIFISGTFNNVIRINKTTYACSRAVDTLRYIDLASILKFNGKNVPAYPSSPTVPQLLAYDTDNTLKYVDTPNKNISDAYDNTKTYEVGDTCIYNNVLYKCSTAITTAEDFDATHWTATTVAELVDNQTIVRSNIVQEITAKKTFKECEVEFYNSNASGNASYQIEENIYGQIVISRTYNGNKVGYFLIDGRNFLPNTTNSAKIGDTNKRFDKVFANYLVATDNTNVSVDDLKNAIAYLKTNNLIP